MSGSISEAQLQAVGGASMVNKAPPPTYSPSSKIASETSSDEDLLNRSPLADTLASFLAAPVNKDHQTIGLMGDWGVGKTSFIQQLKKALREKHGEEQPFIFGEYNAWKYEYTESPQAGLAQETIKALSAFTTPTVSGKSPSMTPGMVGKGLFSLAATLILILAALHFLKAYAGLNTWATNLIGDGVVSWLMSASAVLASSSILYLLYLGYLNRQKLLLTFKFGWKLKSERICIFAAVLGLQIVFWCVQYTDDTSVFSSGIGKIAAHIPALLLAGSYKYFQTVWASPMAPELNTYLRLPTYGHYLGTAPVMHNHLQSLCELRLNPKKGPESRFLLVVEDLDRCSYENIVKTFETLRLVMNIPRVTVMIAINQQIALTALAMHYEKLAPQHKWQNPQAIARDYLAKVMHLPITLSEPDAAAVSRYLGSVCGVQADPQQEAPHMAIHKLLPDSPARVNAEGMSSQQKQAFFYWLEHFELSNPRQIKRLYNGYNLLRAYLREDWLQTEDEAPGLSEQRRPLAYPMMVALFAMEYVNDHPDQLGERGLHYWKKFLRGERVKPLEDGDSLGRIDHDVLTIIKEPAWEDKLIPAIKAFVLPAIETEEIEPVLKG
ncbi:P-loop NTPase fold protein [Hahella aquimaris]|uniref:P-loop NTPase fold protein n=1 Tax=Hahella sp. HNIBRBA332 TaxID=3015983 RepID=UPI00273C22AE|nr:P-loop NTPase fold protein [Hahella sp. HNIBRBA332]WLQ12732.1 P-loop NTPase fold protein [Hahella sp. HNIBRBA332]